MLRLELGPVESCKFNWGTAGISFIFNIHSEHVSDQYTGEFVRFHCTYHEFYNFKFCWTVNHYFEIESFHHKAGNESHNKKLTVFSISASGSNVFFKSTVT